MSAKSVDAKSHTQRKAAASGEDRVAWPDTRLVQECLQGSEVAWSALIEKYKNLIFSIPIKYGFSPDDASDIFQGVCTEMLAELAKLRKPKALPKWIMQVTAHKCFHQKRQIKRTENRDFSDESREEAVPEEFDGLLAQAEEEQLLRDAIFALPPRCRELIRMLFFEEPARPYEAIASELGLATGSIGFIRQRCLERLRKRLMEAGFA
jgi:RNA polymerase sigma factor (sigma-70 family)